MKIKFAVLLIVGLFSSCIRQKNTSAEILTDCFDLFETKDLTFILDSETTQNTDCLQFIDSLLIFGNSYDNSLVFYDFPSGNYKRKIKFAWEGGDGVGKSIFTYYRNEDSIFVWNYTMNTLFLLNSCAKMQWKASIPPAVVVSKDSLFLPPQIMPRTNNLMTQLGNRLLLSGMFFGEIKGENSSNRPVFVWYDLTTGKVTYSDSYPAIYHSGNWGGDFTYRFPYYTANASDEVVLSFAAEPDIRVSRFDSLLKSRSYYAGIGGEEEAIPPINNDFDPNHFNSEENIRHYVENLSYSSIHYDKWRDVYYRIAMLPITGDVDIHAPIIRKPLVVIVLDKDFQIICRKQLPQDDYLVNQCFVSEKGLHIQVQSSDDDIMRFKTFKLEEI